MVKNYHIITKYTLYMYCVLRCWLSDRKGIRSIKIERWGAGMVICLERGADLHMTQQIPLPLTVFCFSKMQIGFTFLVPAHPGSPRQRAVKRVCVYTTSSRGRSCHRRSPHRVPTKLAATINRAYPDLFSSLLGQ